MRLRNKVEPRHYEESLREIRSEREAETKQAERLSAILAKKSHSVTKKSPTKVAWLTPIGPGSGLKNLHETDAQ